MRKVLVVVALAWIGVSVAGARVSIDRMLPYDLPFLDASGSANNVLDDWLYGWGTGLTVPLAFLAVVAIMTVLSTFAGDTGRLAALTLAVLGAAGLGYAAANQVTHDRLTATVDPDRTVDGLILANIVLCSMLVLVGLLAWLTSPRDDFR